MAMQGAILPPSSNPTSPITTKPKSTLLNSDAVPLDSPLRTHPIHPSIPSVRLPAATPTTDPTTLNPLTLAAFTPEDLQTHNFVALKEQFRTPEDARRAWEDAIRDLKEKLDDNERKTKEVERLVEERKKTREIERKVFEKKLGKDGG